MMIRKEILASALVLSGAWFGLNSFAQPGPATHGVAGGSTGEIADAAKMFLATLDDAQRGK